MIKAELEHSGFLHNFETNNNKMNRNTQRTENSNITHSTLPLDMTTSSSTRGQSFNI